MTANRDGSWVRFIDPAGSGGPSGSGIYDFRVAGVEGARGLSMALKTQSHEEVAARPFVVDLLPLSRGLGPGREWDEQTYIDGWIDTSWREAIYPGATTNATTLTSAAAQGIGAVNWNGKLWVIAGATVYSINSGHGVTSERALGQTATWITVIGGELFVCTGSAGKIQKSTTAGTWSTSGDVYAYAMCVVRDKVWKVGNSTATIDNNISSLDATQASLATACMTLANWNTAAGYTAGDSSYQAYAIYDYAGVPWVARNDGIFAPDPETRFLNQTPLLAQRPSNLVGKGAWVGDGYLWVPTGRELLRVEPGAAVPVGPEMIRAAGHNYRVSCGVHTDVGAYLLVYDGKNAIQYLMKMEYDPRSRDSYLFTPIVQKAATQYGKWVALNAASGASIDYGGGSAATSAGWTEIGTYVGRDVDDSNYAFSSSSYFVTGPFRPVPGSTTRCLFQYMEVLTGAIATSQNVTVAYLVDGAISTTPSTTALTTAEGGGTANIASAGRALRYFATGTIGSWINLKVTVPGNDSSSRTELRGLKLHGIAIPEITDEVHLSLIAGSRVRDRGGLGQGMSGHDAHELFRRFQRAGTPLTVEIKDYEDDRTTRFMVTDVQATASGADAANGSEDLQWTINLSLLRIDYANAFAA